ncbi:hypothetical protein CHS0354_026878 [Potamilus streckersoni]|uniref:Uncharacterized protein n=1 Tax=Potamilus streckersoni TaxID=2493646 RepID=A0AAE0SQ69_9BIVA|nr:hypothetical protein CHS0354_026878 [Potamilus streckersoni]
MAFCTWKEKVLVDASAERQLLEEYCQKLIINGEVILDPHSLKDGWKVEKETQLSQNATEGICECPPPVFLVRCQRQFLEHNAAEMSKTFLEHNAAEMSKTILEHNAAEMSKKNLEHNVAEMSKTIS